MARKFLVLAVVAALAATAALGFGVRATEAAPTASTGGPYAGAVGQSIQFSAVNSLNVVRFVWNFGDNTTGAGIMPTKSYGAAGVYTVTLTVTDEFGQTATATTTATIGGGAITPSIGVSINGFCQFGSIILLNGFVTCASAPFITINTPFCPYFGLGCIIPVVIPVTPSQNSFPSGQSKCPPRATFCPRFR